MGAAALQSEVQTLARDVHRLIRALDPATFHAELDAYAKELMGRVRLQLQRAMAAAEQGRGPRMGHAVGERLAALKTLVDDFEKNLDWKLLFRRIQPAYAGIVSSLPHVEVELPRLRPTNVTRSIFHVLIGILSLALIHLLDRTTIRWMVTPWVGFVVFAEVSRRYWPAWNAALMRAFGRIAHPHEHHRVNSASWFSMALLVLAFTSSDLAAGLAVVVLGFADPAAAAVGRKYGRIRLADGRSLEGTVAFFLTGALVSLGTMALLHPELGTSFALVLACVAGASGALVELTSRRLDDNFTIPVAVAAAVSLAVRLV